MRQESKVALLAMAKPRPRQKPWEWLGENIDYGRVPNYDTENKSQYDPDFFPGWKELLEMSFSRDVRELWVLKCSRAGGTENLLLGGLRYSVARAPATSLFITGSQTAAEGMMRRRIKRGFGLASETAKKFARAHELEHEIFFEEMDFRVGWVADKMIYKGDGYERLYGDEVSVWPLNASDLLRKRTAGYAFSTIVAVSSLDPKAGRPTSADPIWIEYKNGNQLNWYMPDPKTRRWFKFEKGDRGLDTPGLKWDQDARREDGTWDLDRVRATAYYQTPDGTKILNKNRMKVARRGKWVAENPNAPAGIVSAKYVSPMTPLKSGDFGELAVNFLKAKMKKNPQYMRTYLYEEWCEEHTDNMLRVSDSLVHDRVEPNHTKGRPLFSGEGYMAKFYERKQCATFMGIDMQQAHMVAYAEEYVDGGDHATLDWRHVVTWEEAEQFANQLRASQIWVDYGYARRQLEVLRACHQLGTGWIPAKGAENINLPYKQTFLDPFEGTARQREETSVLTYSWHTDIFKMMKLDLLKGESDRKWYMYNHPEAMLANQIASEERIEGIWVVKSGHENHLWDCSVLCLLAAVVSGIFESGYRLAGK